MLSITPLNNRRSEAIAFFSKKNYKKIKHESGLTIILNTMPQYSYTYVIMGVKYGSINNEFKDEVTNEFLSLPEGIAHFLEHKMFENEDGEDTFHKFAKTGAIANAYTALDQTCYFFSCSENFKESLKILLDYVTHPYFTDENVKKEQGIIAQEIKMCQDNPDWRGFFSILQGLYSKIPVFNDIAGSQQSISKITPQHLYKCYKMFYNLNNMVLSIAGNFNIDDVISVADQVLVKSEDVKIINKVYSEPLVSVKKESVIKLPIEIPLIKIGFKHLPCKKDRDNFILNMKLSLINALIIGPTSSVYGELYYNEIISKPISSEVIYGPGYLASIFSIETKHPHIVKQRIFEAIDKIKKQGLPGVDFISIKKGFYGSYIMDMNNPEIVATNHMDGHLNGLDFRKWHNVIMGVTKSELENIMNQNYNYESSTVSIVEPLI